MSVLNLQYMSWLILSGNCIERIPTEWNAPEPLQLNQLDLTENFIQVWILLECFLTITFLE